MPFLERDGGVRVFYEIYGEKGRPWVTLLNGFSRSSQDFRGMAKHLERCGFRVLTPDNRGAGQTESTGAFTLEDLMDDLDALWKELGVVDTALLGISYGGVLSTSATLKFPDLVDRLILISTSATSRLIQPTVPLDTSDPKTIEESLMRYFSKGFLEKNPILMRSLLKDTAKAFLDDDLREKANLQRAALREFDFLSDLARIGCPVLLVHGSEDAIIPPTAARLTSHHIPQSKMEIFEGAGHLLLAEMPKRLYDVVTEFLMQ